MHMFMEKDNMMTIALPVEYRLIELKRLMHYELYDDSRFSPIVYFKINDEIGRKIEIKIKAADIQNFLIFYFMKKTE